MEPEEKPTAPENLAAAAMSGSFFSRISRKKLIASITGGLAVIAIVVLVGLSYHSQASKPTGCSNDSCKTNTAVVSPVASASPTATPTLVTRKLDGVLVPEGEESIRPLGVMIENHPDARPQSGLSSANWVYEAIAEGGITRFLALFANPDTLSTRVGPIRSVRTYYLDYAREYNAFLSHVGGNIDALDSIQANGGITNLDQFAIGEPTYKRDFSRSVALEHTMYSTTTDLWKYIVDNKYDKAATFDPLVFADDAAQATRPASEKIAINFSSPAFAVRWDYDPTTNTYARTMAGTAHKDAVGDKQITAKNIVLQTVDRKATVTRINEDGWIYTLTGSGKVVVIENGVATVGTWERTGNGRTRYYKADGTEMTLTRGTTWVEVVHADTSTSY